MNKGSQYALTPVEFKLKCLSSKERKEQLVQYNVDQNLKFLRWRFTGPEPKTASDYDQLLHDLLSSSGVCETSKISPVSSGSLALDVTALKLSVTSMTFFDNLESSGAYQQVMQRHNFNVMLSVNIVPYFYYRYRWSWWTNQGLL
jgi:hypothetical protein